jgi:hypothetical protein
MAIGPLSRLWQLARKIEELFTLHGKVEASLQVIDQRLKTLEDRMLRLESEQAQSKRDSSNLPFLETHLKLGNCSLVNRTVTLIASSNIPCKRADKGR